jgi:hypothetical protein
MQPGFLQLLLAVSQYCVCTTAIRLASVFVAVARWSEDLLVIFITFGLVCTAINDYY